MSKEQDAFEFQDMSEAGRSTILGERDEDDNGSPKGAGRVTKATTWKANIPLAERAAHGQPPVVAHVSLPKDGGFEFRDISYTTPAGKSLIQNISATVGKGEMLAIMVCRPLVTQKSPLKRSV
jgi:hypothetical protein